ncbi:hypothetical protein F4775DRAFT_341126 [Biscogniauxia sp. FL1348]|nr:hypothetical protein F4775DRAFT_341126 [Biscogniauxia sp. FL1348]
MSSRFNELECAACDVIQIIKQIPELEHTRLLVIGGLALWHYLADYRSTDNINFITNISTSPSWVKKRLLEWPNASFVQRSQILYYQSPSGREVQVDISPEWLSPYLPASAPNIRDIPYGEVPYISLTDLIVFKLDSSGLRSSLVKRERDARDAAALVEYAVGQRLKEARPPLELSRKQEKVVEEALCDVSKCGAKEKVWWERHLGLMPAESGLDYASLEGGRREDERAAGRCRFHSNSDPGTSWWYYERLDRAHAYPNHVSRLAWLRRSNPVDAPTAGAPAQDGPSPVRAGVARSASCNGHGQWSGREYHHLIQKQQQQRPSRVPAATMTQPKTTTASLYGYTSSSSPRSWLKRPSLAGSDSGYSSGDSDGNFYYLEPTGSTSTSSGGGGDNGAYTSGWLFDDEWEEEVGKGKRALKSGGMSKRMGRTRGSSDLSSCGSAIGGGLETVPEHENEKTAVKRSVTFQV